MEGVGAGQFRARSARRRVGVGSVGVGGTVEEDVVGEVGVVEKRVNAAWMADSVLALMWFSLARAEAFGTGLVVLVVEGREGRARLGFRRKDEGLAPEGFGL